LKRSTFGSVVKLPSGAWRLRWWADTKDGRKRCSEVVRGTRREAERRLAEIRVKTEGEEAPTVDEIWSEQVRPLMVDDIDNGRRSKQTLLHYDAVYKRSILPRWGHVPVEKVSAADIQDWLMGLKKTEGQHAKKVLGSVTSRAVMMGYMPTDPCANKFRYSDVHKTLSEGIWDLGQLDKAWTMLRGDYLELPFLLCAHAGLRTGEAFGLQVGDLDYDGEHLFIHVERAWSNQSEVVGLKTKTSRRIAVMEHPYAGRVAELVAEGNGTWLMDDGMGKPSSRNLATRHWVKIFKDSELPYITMSRLRNCYETYMHWERGVSQKSLSKILGHSTVKTTQTFYDLPDVDTVVSAFVQEIDAAK